MKRILTIVAVMVVVLASFTNVYASEGFFNIGVFETAYRLSKQEEIELPFINVFSKAATYDELVKHSGISIGESTIDIDEKLEGMHFIVAGDMITIKGEVEHGIIYGTNIVVEGKISGDTILMGSTVQILENAVIEEDLIVVADDFVMNGTVKGNVIGATSNATVNGIIEKDLRLEVVSLELDKGTIKEDLRLSVLKDYDVSNIIAKYPDAVITRIVEDTETVSFDGTVIIDGIKVVTIYVIVAWVITRKENNIAEKAKNRFMENSSFGILMGAAMIMLIVVVPILLIALLIYGLEAVVWPLLIAYFGIILLSMSMSSFVVGITFYEAIKHKINKYKIPVLIVIFAVLYALLEIPYVSTYAWIVINLISMAVIMAYIFKREEKIEVAIVEDKVK